MNQSAAITDEIGRLLPQPVVRVGAGVGSIFVLEFHNTYRLWILLCNWYLFADRKIISSSLRHTSADFVAILPGLFAERNWTGISKEGEQLVMKFSGDMELVLVEDIDNYGIDGEEFIFDLGGTDYFSCTPKLGLHRPPETEMEAFFRGAERLDALTWRGFALH